MIPPLPPASPRDPFADALDAIITGDCSPRDHAVLNETLRRDPAARRTYLKTMAFEAMLAREFAPPEESQQPVPGRRRWHSLAAIAATIALATALAWQFQPGPASAPDSADSAPDGDDEISLAVITSLDDASGRFGHDALVPGLRLTGGLLELDRGVAEITFDSGAEVTLEGPARLQLESENKTLLATGRAAAYVPEQARGFVIHTPSSYIRDLGTAFAVEVRDDRETDLHVLEGEVEAAPAGRNSSGVPKIIRQLEAVRLTSGTMSPINFRAADPAKPRRSKPNKIPPSVHWSFDSWDGHTTTDPASGRVLKLQPNRPGSAPDLLEGPFGTAIHFNGEGTFGRSDYPGVGGSQARTIACWIRLQPGDSRAGETPNGIICWGANRPLGKWQLAWNKAQGQGNPGATRVEFGDGFAVASTDLRDGRWHHLAVVCLGGPRANVATHVRVYVDGKLDPLTGRRRQMIATDTTSAAAQPVIVGRYLGRLPGHEPRFFEGDLDEIHIFEGPLLPGQIVRLMRRNSVRFDKP